MKAMTTIFIGGTFPTGRVVRTQGVIAEVPEDEALKGLLRHISGDWGDLDEQDWKVNDTARTCGFRLLSRYVSPSGTAFWIITEHDRSVTTILLPEEY
jgi:hypothetical protein